MLDKWPAVAYNADTPTCFLSSSHATQQLSAMLYMVTDRDILWPSCNGHGICTTHSDIMPPRIDAPRSADLLYTVARYRYTVLAVGKHEDHYLRRPKTKAIYPGPWGRHGPWVEPLPPKYTIGFELRALQNIALHGGPELFSVCWWDMGNFQTHWTYL